MMEAIFNIFYPATHNHEDVLMKLSELTAVIAEISAQLTKVQDEILNRISTLENTLGDVDLPEAAITAINALRSQVQALDDVVPDQII